METSNLQHFLIGEGNHSKELYFTLDFIPIRITIKYNYNSIEIPMGESFNNQNAIINEEPDFISKIYTSECYNVILKFVCKKLGIEEREICMFKSFYDIKFNFNKDTYFYEWQYGGMFGRKYFVQTNIRHALNFVNNHDNLFNLHNVKKIDNYDWINYKRNDEEFQQINSIFYQQRDYLISQGILKNKDFHNFSKTTIDLFIENLKKSSKK